MKIEISIECKVLGWELSFLNPWPVEIDSPDFTGTLSLRDLITQLVKIEVDGWRERQNERRLLHVMTADDIDESRRHGKFDFGNHPVENIDERVAVKTALQAFEDGLYFVFIDGDQCETLDDLVAVQSNSQLRFLRLIPLAGG